MATVQPGDPGKRREGDDLAPLFRLTINDQPLNYDINRLIQTVEYESAIDMADMFNITIDNPGLISDEFPDWTGHKAFQPGNEATLYVGYGDNLNRPSNFVGRCIWAKHLPIFPREGMPQLQVKGYDLSHKMMDNEGPVTSAGLNTKPVTARPVDFTDDQGQVFQSITHSEIVERIARMYGVDMDIDETSKREHLIIKKGRKHYELIKGLANLNNRDFWIDWNPVRKKWTLHWKIRNRNQGPQYIFRYGADNQPPPSGFIGGIDKWAASAGTLFNAEPEYGIRETISTATILIYDGINQRWVSAIEIDDASGPDPFYRPGGGIAARAALARRPRPKKPGAVSTHPRQETRAHYLKRNAKDMIHEALENATSFRISAGGVSIDVLPPGIRFKTPEDAAAYLLRWFQQRQDNFITLKGNTIGVETLRARQVHTIRGLGDRLDGDYFFTRVAHRLAEDAYVCDFTANKVIKE